MRFYLWWAGWIFALTILTMFIEWSVSPQGWDQSTRGFYMFACLVFGPMFAGVMAAPENGKSTALGDAPTPRVE